MCQFPRDLSNASLSLANWCKKNVFYSDIFFNKASLNTFFVLLYYIPALFTNKYV